MDDSELEHLRVKLKSGEYDGVDIMRAWLALDEARSMRKDAERYRYARRHMDPRTPPLWVWVGCAGSEEFSRQNDEAIDAAMNGANA